MRPKHLNHCTVHTQKEQAEELNSHLVFKNFSGKSTEPCAERSVFSTYHLIEQKEVMELLGYSDERSIKRWCKERKIPIIRFGLKEYVIIHLYNAIY